MCRWFTRSPPDWAVHLKGDLDWLVRWTTRVEARLSELIAAQAATQRMEEKTMAAADDAVQAVNDLTAAVDQLITLCDSNFTALENAIAAGSDATQLQDIITKARAELDAVKSAQQRDTPPTPHTA